MSIRLPRAIPLPKKDEYIVEGEIDQAPAFAISDEELEQGYRLICIGSPLSDVVSDA